MILYPAIDLKDGQCVRLLKGEMDAATVFSDNPAAQARAFQDAGAQWVHLVDLNGAFAGEPVNGNAVEAILSALDVPAQLGGGIRDMATIEAWLAKGLARVILGTVAVEDPDLVRDAAKAFPGQIAVGLDAREGTDINRDGAMAGPNLPATEALARAVDVPIIASGGVSSMADLRALKATGVISGAISGRALYDGAIDLAEALTMLDNKSPLR